MNGPQLYCFQADCHSATFPPLEQALSEPDGLLAAGGDLSAARLIDAYSRGIFPWFEPDQAILWWSPNPRCVLYPARLHQSRSLQKTLRKKQFSVTFDQAFEQVIAACAEPRTDSEGTWITPEMAAAYTQLHRQKFAHSVEVWQNNDLVGGLYGVAIGQIFFGESMFSRVSNASKVALATMASNLLEWDYRLIDCQVHSAHLSQLGAESIPRAKFVEELATGLRQSVSADAWRAE